MPTRVRALVLLVLIGLGGSFGLHLLERAMIFPAPEVPTEWLQQRAQTAGATELKLTAEDGTTLYGWHVPARGEGVVLWFDGNGATVGQRSEQFRALVAEGWDVVHVNYRGYPGSEGRPSEAGLRQDARAAWAYAEKVAPRRVIYGKSLGGGVAVGLAAERPAHALVLESTFTRISDVARSMFAGAPVDLLMRSPFDSLALAPKITCPTLILHGQDDTLIPASQARNLAAALGGPHTVEILPGLGHNASLLMTPVGWELAMLTLGSPAQR